MQLDKSNVLIGSGNIVNRFVVVSLIVILLFSVSYLLRDVWFAYFCRPFDSLHYLGAYFMSLWFFGIFFADKLMSLNKWKRYFFSSFFMHFVSLFISIYVLGFIHYDNYIDRIINSWNMSGVLTYFNVTIVLGSAVSFMLGGWLFGVLMIVFFGIFKRKIVQCNLK
jgi:hypothetical protein